MKNCEYKIHFNLVNDDESFNNELDIFSSNNQSYKYVLLVIDDTTYYKFIYFLMAKNEASDVVEFHFKYLKELSINVVFARFDQKT